MYKRQGLPKRSAKDITEYVCDSCRGAPDASTRADAAVDAKDGDYDAAMEEADDDDDDEGGEQLEAEDEFEEEPQEEPEEPEVEPTPRRSVRAREPAARPTKRSKSSADPVREHVLKTFIDILEPLFATTGCEKPRKAAETYATDLETELYLAHGDFGSGLRIYKERFRTMSFNLKDKRNTSLHDRVTSGSLAAKELAHLSNEALANDDIREKMERAKRAALEQTVIRQDDSGPARKITHKGEVDIERDDQVAPQEARNDEKFVTEEPQNEDSQEAPAQDTPAAAEESPAEEARSAPPAPIFAQVWSEKEGTGDAETPLDVSIDDTEQPAEPDAQVDNIVDGFLDADDTPAPSTLSPTHSPEPTRLR